MTLCTGVRGSRKVAICKTNWRNCGNEGIVTDGMYLFCLGLENSSLASGLNTSFTLLLIFPWGKAFKTKHLNIVDAMSRCNTFPLLPLQRTVERWLRKEIDEQRRLRKERLANGLPEFEDQNPDGTRVVGESAKKVAMNNGWAGGRLHSTLAGEENVYDLSSNRVLRV